MLRCRGCSVIIHLFADLDTYLCANPSTLLLLTLAIVILHLGPYFYVDFESYLCTDPIKRLLATLNAFTLLLMILKPIATVLEKDRAKGRFEKIARANELHHLRDCVVACTGPDCVYRPTDLDQLSRLSMYLSKIGVSMLSPWICPSCGHGPPLSRTLLSELFQTSETAVSPYRHTHACLTTRLSPLSSHDLGNEEGVLHPGSHSQTLFSGVRQSIDLFC